MIIDKKLVLLDKAELVDESALTPPELVIDTHENPLENVGGRLHLMVSFDGVVDAPKTEVMIGSRDDSEYIVINPLANFTAEQLANGVVFIPLAVLPPKGRYVWTKVNMPDQTEPMKVSAAIVMGTHTNV